MSAIIIDTETHSSESPRVIEAAWMRVGSPLDLTALESFHACFNPGVPIDLGAMAVHHIMDEDVAGCPPSSSFSIPSDVRYIIGHKVDFDWEAIGRPDVKRICTLALCRKLWPHAAHSQGAMLYLLDRENARDMLKEAHSACQDINICRIILSNIMLKLNEQNGQHAWDWERLWQVSEEAREPEYMPFGKHKGVAISDVPRDYKDWLLRQPDVDPYLVNALKKT